MTVDEIKENADMAETWPGSGKLNWGEVGFNTLAAWVAEFNWADASEGLRTETFDVESVKCMFEAWWHTQNVPLQGSPEAQRKEIP